LTGQGSGKESSSQKLVVAAVIEKDGRLLLCRRPLHKRHGGLWEFPGGKIEEGESILQAAARELEEELSMQATKSGPPQFSILDEASGYTIQFVKVEAEGDPQLNEHMSLAWVEPSSLYELDLAPSDRAFAEHLKKRDFRT